MVWNRPAPAVTVQRRAEDVLNLGHLAYCWHHTCMEFIAGMITILRFTYLKVFKEHGRTVTWIKKSL